MANPAGPAPNFDYRGELRVCRIRTVERMKAIIHALDAPMDVLRDQGIDEEALDVLFEELQDLVSSTVMSSAFHQVGGLETILNCLRRSDFDSEHRRKAANVLATLMWGNLHSQQLVLKAYGFELLFDVFTLDHDTRTRADALDAIFSLIRNNKPAITTFRLENGYEALKDALTSQDVYFQMKALDFIYLILQKDHGESQIMLELGYPHMIIGLRNSEDKKVRESALWALLELTCLMRDDDNNNINDIGEAMRKFLEERIQHFISLGDKDLKEARRERVLVDTLWRSCFNEPSCLRDIGLLVLPGEDAISPYFERGPFASPIRPFDIEHALSYYTSSSSRASSEREDSDSNDSTISTEKNAPK